MNTTPAPAFTLNEVFTNSKDIVQKHWGQYLILMLTAVLMYAAVNLVYGLLAGMLGLPGMIDELFGFVTGVYVSLVMVAGSLAIVRGQKLDLPVLVKVDGKLYLQALLASLLFYIMVFFGLLFLIIPGIIVLILFGFYTFSLVDKQTSAVQALEDSMNMTKPNMLTIFLFHFILTAITGLVVAVPAMLLFSMAVGSDVSGGALILIGGVVLIVVIALAVFLGMMRMSGQAYMYTKMREKTPLAIKK